MRSSSSTLLRCGTFQCSSASRKFLNRLRVARSRRRRRGFSALQRAENSSIRTSRGRPARRVRFQCSSASRKFLNRQPARSVPARRGEFQCSSASRKFLNSRRRMSVSRWCAVSVLFSEPKIPQCDWEKGGVDYGVVCFSALQRAENSSIDPRAARPARARGAFQCSSASRKFLNM